MQTPCIYINKLEAIRPDNKFKVTLCFCHFSSKKVYDGVIEHLHIQERTYYHTLKFDRRIRSYLLGRFVAKQAVSALTGEKRLTNIHIQSGIFTQPIVVSDQKNIQVSITHCDDFGAAIAFPEAHPMGIDIEKCDPNKIDAFTSQMTQAEVKLLHSLKFSDETGCTLLWTAKEALSKILKTGLMTPFEVFEISKVEITNDSILCYYKNFAQYKVTAFRVADYICSIAYPLKTKLSFDSKMLKEKFSFIEAPVTQPTFLARSHTL